MMANSLHPFLLERFKSKVFISLSKVQIDINQPEIKVCCKKQNSIFQKIYYFLFNPFFQIHDYSCKNTDQNGFVKDSASIAKLGLIQILFKQQQFPACSKGILGLNNQSYFSSLLPVNLKSFTIFQNPSEFKKYTLKFGQDLSAVKEYSYFNVTKGYNWAIQLDNIKFNQILLGNSPLVLNSNKKSIQLPNKMYEFVSHQLINSFDCRIIDQQIYCPCQTGQTDSYPKLYFTMHNSQLTLQIEASSYMTLDSQTCRVQLQISQSNQLQISILFFREYQFKFDQLNHRMGILKNLNDQTNNQFFCQKIKLPLQLILNCLVILLLCIFLALVIIEITKRVSGLAQAREEVFRVDVREKNKYSID